MGQVPVNEDKNKHNNFHFDMDKYVDEYLPAYYYAKEQGLFWGSFLTINFDGEAE